jgi:probable HAF family extracellular repeat protein
MKSHTWVCMTAVSLFAVLLMPTGMAAQDSPSQGVKHRHQQYTLIDVGTLGGPASYINNPFALGAPNQINSRGTTVGAAATPIPSPQNSNTSICEGIDGNTPFVFHAFMWQDGVVTDLGSLPGPDNCSVATSVNEDGEIAGYSENGATDPLTGIREIRAVRWKDGRIKDLGTFGGNQSLVSNINNRGQIFGEAMNTVLDPYSLYYNLLGFSTGTQTRAFLWQDGQKQDLGTLGGPDAAAFFGNDRGQVIGGSYTNSIPNPTTGIPTLDPFLWERGTMIDLGTLGGTDGSAFLLNNQGQVVGYSNLAGDQTSHPFLWQLGELTDLFTTTIGGSPITANQLNGDGEIVGGGAFPGQTFDAYLWRNGFATDLGRLAGDCTSEGVALNSNEQVIGYSLSCDSHHRAVLWEGGSMIDLNTVIPGDSGLTLKETLAINERGQIAGDAAPTGCLNYAACGHAYILIPSGDCDDDCDGRILASQNVAEPAPSPATVKEGNALPVDLINPLSNRLMHRYQLSGQAAAPRD